MTRPASVATWAVGVALLAAGLPGQARADQIAARTRGPASPPPAFVNFCAKNPSECRRSGAVTRQVVLTPERQRDLHEVNARVNPAISEISDPQHHGREDVWSIPTDGQGDCEDFALLKRKQLIERGWPSSALLIAVVGTPSGEGHAVLMAATSEGDLVLDNKTSRLLNWTQTGYLFFTRMSQANPRAWEAIDGGTIAVTATAVAAAAIATAAIAAAAVTTAAIATAAIAAAAVTATAVAAAAIATAAIAATAVAAAAIATAAVTATPVTAATVAATAVTATAVTAAAMTATGTAAAVIAAAMAATTVTTAAMAATTMAAATVTTATVAAATVTATAVTAATVTATAMTATTVTAAMTAAAVTAAAVTAATVAAATALAAATRIAC